MFELPDFVGIESAIADVRAYGTRTGKEKLIALRKDGKYVFEVEGNDHTVNCPPEWEGKISDALLIHCHPGLSTELSDADLYCILGMGAWGNLAAACEDDTISWTTGLKARREDGYLMFKLLFEPKVQGLQQFLVSKLAIGEGIKNDAEFKTWIHSWAENDDRYVVLSHKLNEELATHQLLKDYHVQVGEHAQRALARYPEFIKTEWIE